MRFTDRVPMWLWLIVIGGLGYGLFEVGLRERRSARARARRLRGRANRLGFTLHAREQHRELTRLMLVLPDLDRPGRVGPVFDGQLSDGTPMTVFDFVEGADSDWPDARVGFVLHYPTEWPTLALGATGIHALDASGVEHDFSRAILASELCEYLAARPDWLFAFSGGSVFGATARHDDDHFDELLSVAAGIADRVPSELITRWGLLPVQDESERRAS
jgi:hypothetical protein